MILEHGLQRLVKLQASAVIGADAYDQTAGRTTQRNGHRTRLLDSVVGRLEIHIPKLRTGEFFPRSWRPGGGMDRALLSVIQEAYVPASARATLTTWSSPATNRRPVRTSQRPAEGSYAVEIGTLGLTPHLLGYRFAPFRPSRCHSRPCRP